MTLPARRGRNHRSDTVTYFLPSNQTDEHCEDTRVIVLSSQKAGEVDLRLFWGAEYYRIEYLQHLVDTGRVKIDRRAST